MFYLWWIGTVLKYCKVPKYHDQDQRCIMYTLCKQNLNIRIAWRIKKPLAKIFRLVAILFLRIPAFAIFFIMAKKTGNIDVGYLTISTNITSWKVDFYVYHCFEDIYTLSFYLQKGVKLKKIAIFVKVYTKNYGSYHNDIFRDSF